MIDQCPHCRKQINLSGAQRQKIEDAYDRLEPGGSLKIGCPHCSQPIHLKKEADAWEGVDRHAEMPDPPKAPDTSWIATGEFDEKEEVKDVPKALVLMPEGNAKTKMVGAFVELFYQVSEARSAESALDQMRYMDFTIVVLHSGFEAGGLLGSSFHKHMCQMAMSKRRNMYYVLIGPEFKTFYNLEALAFSANLVVNDSDANHMKTIIRKGLRDNAELFGPFLQALKALGKQ